MAASENRKPLTEGHALMARRQKYDYFRAFVKISDHAVEYAQELVRFLGESYDAVRGEGQVNPEETYAKLHELHAIEESCDALVHEVTEFLIAEFITPIEREDIMTLVDELDDVVDGLDDVLQRMYMYNVSLITSEIIEMADVVLRSTQAVQSTCQKFTHYKKSRSIHDFITEIHALEDEGDRTYIRCVHDIYVGASEGRFENSAVAYGLTGVMSALEHCCDSCEAAGDTIVTVIMKNS